MESQLNWRIVWVFVSPWMPQVCKPEQAPEKCSFLSTELMVFLIYSELKCVGYIT